MIRFGDPVLHNLESHLAVVRNSNFVSLGYQRRTQNAGDLWFIVHDKNMGMFH